MDKLFFHLVVRFSDNPFDVGNVVERHHIVLTDRMGAWFKIGKIEGAEMSSLDNLRTVNSAYPLEETLRRSSSGYFLVHEVNGIVYR